MLSIKFYLPYLFRHTYFLRLVPNTTSALEPKMVHTDPKPRYLEQKECGVLFFGPGKADGKRYAIKGWNKSTKSTTSRKSQYLRGGELDRQATVAKNATTAADQLGSNFK